MAVDGRPAADLFMQPELLQAEQNLCLVAQYFNGIFAALSNRVDNINFDSYMVQDSDFVAA
jgi:hypothetical protein